MDEVRTTMSEKDAVKLFDMATNPGYGDRHKREAERLAKKLGKQQKYKNQFKAATMDGLSVLNFAVQEGHVFIAKLLMKHLAVNPNTTQHDKRDRTTLHYSAQGGQLDLVTDLLTTYHSDPSARDKCGSTPLHLAIFNDHPATALKIIELGGNAELQNHFGMAMHAAAFTGCQSVVAAIAEKFPHQVNAVVSGFVTPLVCAIFGDEPECENFLQRIVSVEEKALFYKVVSSKTEETKAFASVQTLLQQGADPNLCEEVLGEDLAIICAAKKGWSNVVFLLLKETRPISGVNWNVNALIEHVNTEQFKQRDSENITTRVNLLKSKILEELKAENCLTALVICMSLKCDMDDVQWDKWISLCKFVTFMFFQACPVKCNLGSIRRWVRILASAGNKKPASLGWAITGVKGCLALSPNNPEFMNLYNTLTGAPGN